MKKKIIKNPIIALTICVALIFVIVYIIKGVFPFGKKTIVQGDLNSYIIAITHIIKSIRASNFHDIIFSNLTYSGASNTVFLSWMNPFFIIYLFCINLDKLMYYMSFVIIIKCILSAITAYICFSKLYGKSNVFLNFIFSLGYAFSSYAIINHSTLMWIDIVIVFPLIICALNDLIKKKKIFWYSILIALTICISYQLGYMILISILISTFIAIKVLNFEDKGKIVLALGIGTILGILLSSVLFLPMMKVYINSGRINNSQILLNSYYFSTKLAYILFSSTLVFALLKGIKYIKKDKNICFFIIIIFLVGICPIFFEGINLIWHGGQYDSFPFRFGFIVIFYMELLAIYYYKKYLKEEFSGNRERYNYKLFFDIYIPFSIMIFITLALNISNPVFQIPYIITIALILYNVFMIKLYNKLFYIVEENNYYYVLLFVEIIEIFLLVFGCVGISKNIAGNEHSEVSVKNTLSIKNIDRIEKNDYRYKDYDNLMLENAPLLTRLPANTSWNLSTNEQLELYNILGYSKLTMRLSDVGGTLLSDGILGTRYAFSKEKLDSEIYKYANKENDNIKLYEYKNYFPLGIVYDSSKNINNFPDNLSKLDYQNWIYRNLFGKDEDIIKISNKLKFKSRKISKSDKKDEIKYCKDKYYEIQLKPDFDSILYLEYDNYEYNNLSYYNNFIIAVNDKFIKVPSKCYEDNLYYPNYYNNGLLCLGKFDSNENVNLKIYYINNFDSNKFLVGFLDYNKYIALSNELTSTEYNSENNIINIKVNAEKNQSILIPVTYDDRWTVKINGKSQKVERGLKGLISVKLVEGENDIELEIKDTNLKTGLIISICTFILLMLYELLKDKIINNIFLQNLALFIYYFVVILVFLFVYGFGIIMTLL